MKYEKIQNRSQKNSHSCVPLRLRSDGDIRNRNHRLSATNLFVTVLSLVLFLSAFKIKKLYNSLQLAGRVSFVKKIAISGV